MRFNYLNAFKVRFIAHIYLKQLKQCCSFDPSMQWVKGYRKTGNQKSNACTISP